MFNTQWFKLSASWLVTCSLSACSYIYGEDGLIRDSTYDYTQAKQTKELAIPEHLSQKGLSDYAQVPKIGNQAEKGVFGKELSEKAPVQILAVMDSVRVDNNAEEPTVLVADDIDFLWQSLQKLFEENEITPSISDKTNYFLDTGWLAVDERGVWLGIEPEEEVDEFRAKYQIKMLPGMINGEVQLQVRRVSAEKENEDSGQWEPVTSFWQDSAEMMNFILVNYERSVIERDGERREQMLAGFKVELGTDNENNPALLTMTEKEMVWDKLPKVLELVNLKIEDKDRRSMTYFMKYEKEEPGFFASLFSDEESSLELEEGNYQVVLSDKGDQTAMTFNNAQGQPLDANTMTKIFPRLSQLFVEKR